MMLIPAPNPELSQEEETELDSVMVAAMEG